MKVELQTCEFVLQDLIDRFHDSLYLSNEEVKRLFVEQRVPSEIYKLHFALRALQGMGVIDIKDCPGVGGGYQSVDSISITPKGLAYFPLKEDQRKTDELNRKRENKKDRVNIVLGGVVGGLITAAVAWLLPWLQAR